MTAVLSLPRPVLIFDDIWRFCRWAARLVAMLDRREELALLPFSDAASASLLASAPEEKHNSSWWIILSDGRPIPGDGGGGVALLNEMQATRMLGRLLAALRLSRFIDALDRFVARKRGWLSKVVPQGPALRRYP